MSEEILLGDEAVARGAIDAGISAAYAYPGTPSTEIYQTIQDYAKEHSLPVRGMWSTNEKVALEEGVGVSYAGGRAMVSMKHVGLNVAADPFMNVAVSGAHGGLVIAVADDPSMHSSQNEQDSRYFADFAMVPCLEPGDQQQCYDFTREAFELSERLQVPVLLRLVTRLAHSRAAVTLATPRQQNVPNYVEDSSRFTLLPVNARKAYAKLVDKQPALQDYSENHAGNALTLRGNGKPGILVSGLGWNYLQEAMGDALDGYNLLRIGVYPLPVKKIRQLLDASSEVWIVEEGYPFIERYVSALGLMRERPIHGKMTGALPRMGELTQDTIRRCFGLPVSVSLQIEGLSDVLVGRPPRLCDKCPHTDAYIAIPYVHFLPTDSPTRLCTVGAMYLKFCLDTAEKADHDFALRMQGLQHCSVNAVWCCPDDAYEGSEREDASKRYAERYVRRFLESCGVSGETKSADVVKNTLQMQRDFADGWAREHTHTLSPLVESAGEALIAMFMPSALLRLRGLDMTPRKIFRALRRNQEFSAQIGLCLHHFMVKLEQDRGGRNANYKSMFNASTSNMLALGALAKLFGSNVAGIHDTLAKAIERDPFFHPLLVDWYDIFRQMPVARSDAPSGRL